jgi:CDP-diacylglycerol--serine O-phosphatidyltransferase
MKSKRPPKRGIYLLPTIFTLGNLFCGFFALVLTFRGALASAALLIIAAAVLDGLDGRIARLTGTNSEFGRQFDSLADLVSFGVAPALLAYRWALVSLDRLGWLVAFLFVVCAAMRLARFNLRASVADMRYFAGLPAPSAGAAVACAVFALPETPESMWFSALVAALFVALGLLMVSRLRYRSFKELDLRDRRSYLYVLPVAAVLVVLATHPGSAMLLLAGLYLVSAPAVHLWGLIGRMTRRHAGHVRDGSGEREVADEPMLR